jgi:hypothetical protein
MKAEKLTLKDRKRAQEQSPNPTGGLLLGLWRKRKRSFSKSECAEFSRMPKERCRAYGT